MFNSRFVSTNLYDREAVVMMLVPVHPMLSSCRANAAGDGIQHSLNASCMLVASGHLLHNLVCQGVN